MESGLRTSSFKLMTRSVATRVVNFAGVKPYVNGEALLYSRNPISVEVAHRPRLNGKSRYSSKAILGLLGRILLGYSNKPIQYVSLLGIFVSASAFLVAVALIVRALIVEQPVPGWTSVIVVTSLMLSVILLVLSMQTAYSQRILQQVEGRPQFVIEDFESP